MTKHAVSNSLNILFIIYKMNIIINLCEFTFYIFFKL